MTVKELFRRLLEIHLSIRGPFLSANRFSSDPLLLSFLESTEKVRHVRLDSQLMGRGAK